MRPKLFVCENEPPIHPQQNDYFDQITELQNDFA